VVVDIPGEEVLRMPDVVLCLRLDLAVYQDLGQQLLHVDTVYLGCVLHDIPGDLFIARGLTFRALVEVE